MERNLICPSVCYGCSACGMICPTGAISMKENKKGFLYPCVDQKKCTDCGLCADTCHQDINFHQTEKAYIAKLKDEELLKLSQSGGAFLAMSDIVLNMGGIVYGAVMDDRLETIHARATNEKERNKMRRSKYTQSSMGDTYRYVEKDLMERVVLFSGTPCQVAGLQKYLKKRKADTTNLYTVDLICYGVPSPKIWRDLIKYYEHREGSRIVKAVFRDDDGIWGGEYHSSFYMKNKQIIDTYYKTIFHSKLALRESCYSCEYVRRERMSDFTIGDAWGCKEKDPDFYDTKGISLLIAHTEKTEKILRAIMDTMYIKPVRMEDYMQYNTWSLSLPHRSAKEFWSDYEKKKFNYILCKYGKNNIFLNFRYVLKVLGRKLIRKGIK